RERSRLGTTQRVLAIAVANDLALWSTGQSDVPRERIPDLGIAVSTIATAAGPAEIVITVLHVPVRPLPVASRAASERPRVAVIAAARAPLRLAPVVITIAIAGAGSVSPT